MQRKNMIERKQSPEQKGRTILRNILITVGIMGVATIVCLALQHFSEADTHVPLLFVLAVVIVAAVHGRICLWDSVSDGCGGFGQLCVHLPVL